MAMGSHMSCSYSDKAMYKFDIKALNYKQVCCVGKDSEMMHLCYGINHRRN